MWQPEQPPSQTVASFRRLHCFFSRAVTRKASDGAVVLHLGDGRSLAEDRAGRDRPARTCRTRCRSATSPQGWCRSVMTRELRAAAGDVPGVRPLDLVADAHAAGAEDAAVVVQAEPLVADVHLALRVQVVEAGRGPCRGRWPGPAARSCRWPRRPSRRGCARRRAARRSSADSRWSRSRVGLDVHVLGDLGGARRQQPVGPLRSRPGRAGRRRRRRGRRGGRASGSRSRPRAPPRGSSGPRVAVISLPSIVSVLTAMD